VPPDRLDQLAVDFTQQRFDLNSRLDQIEYSLEGAIKRGHANTENTSLTSARLDALSGHVGDLRQDIATVNTALGSLGGALDKATAFASRLADLERAVHEIAPAPRGCPRPVTGFPVYLGIAATEVD